MAYAPQRLLCPLLFLQLKACSTQQCCLRQTPKRSMATGMDVHKVGRCRSDSSWVLLRPHIRSVVCMCGATNALQVPYAGHLTAVCTRVLGLQNGWCYMITRKGQESAIVLEQVFHRGCVTLQSCCSARSCSILTGAESWQGHVSGLCYLLCNKLRH